MHESEAAPKAFEPMGVAEPTPLVEGRRVPTDSHDPSEDPPPDDVASSCAVGFTTGIDVGVGLPDAYEPSGADWHLRLDRLFVVSDTGLVTSMDRLGGAVTSWDIGGDLEAITIADPNTNLVYVGLEDPDGIVEVDLATGQATRVFDLEPWMTGAANKGLEALTFVPNASHPEGGVFFAGHQEEGSIYVFELPIRSSASSNAPIFLRTFTPVPGRDDLSALEYDPAVDQVYALFDSHDVMIAMAPDGTVLDEWAIPQADQEGLAFAPGCETFIAQDTNRRIWRY